MSEIKIQGYEVLVKKAGAESWIDFFIPEADIYNPTRSGIVHFWILVSGLAYSF